MRKRILSFAMAVVMILSTVSQVVTAFAQTSFEAPKQSDLVSVFFNEGAHGTGSMQPQKLKKNGVYVIPECDFISDSNDWIFDSWLDEENNYIYHPGDQIVISNIIILTAQWKQSDSNDISDDIIINDEVYSDKLDPLTTGHTVEFKPGVYGEGYMDSITVPNDQTVGWKAPECGFTSNNSDYEFDKWQIGETGSMTVSAGGTMMLRDAATILVALWKPVDKTSSGDTCSIIYKNETDEKTVILSLENPYTDGVEIKGSLRHLSPNDPQLNFTAPEGKVFSHWKKGFTTNYIGQMITVTKDKTYGPYEAVWVTADSQTPQLTVKLVEGKDTVSRPTSTEKVSKGQQYTLPQPTVSEYDGGAFSGWVEIGSTYSPNDKLDNRKVYQPGESVTVNYPMNFKAVYNGQVAAKTTVTFTDGNQGPAAEKVSYEIEEGKTFKLPSDLQITADQKISAPIGQELSKWKLKETDTVYELGVEVTANGNQMTFEAQWKKDPNYATVTLYPGNGTCVSNGKTQIDRQIVKNSNYTFPSDQYNVKHTNSSGFKGWKSQDNTKLYKPNVQVLVSDDISFTAVWNYTITFKANEADNGTEYIWNDWNNGIYENSNKDEIGSFKLPPALESKEGKKFLAWKLESDQSQHQPGETFIPKQNDSFVAVWADSSAQLHTVTYEPGDGVGAVKKYNVADKSNYTLLKPDQLSFHSPDALSIEFKAWLCKEDGKEYNPDDIISNVSTDLTFVAIWQAKPQKVNPIITYKAGTGTGNDKSFEVTYNENIVLYDFNAPEIGFTPPSGMKFKCWECDKPMNTMLGRVNWQPGEEIRNVISGMTFTAIWIDEKEETSFTVTLDPGEAKSNPNNKIIINEYTLNTLYSLPECSFEAPEGKEFAGWQKGEKIYKVNDKFKVKTNLTFTAIWQNKSESGKIKLTFVDGFGKKAEKTYDKGVAMQMPDPSEFGFTAPEGMKFRHWELGALSFKAGETYVPNTNAELTAVWWDKSLKEYWQVTFKAGEGEGQNKTIPVRNAEGRNTIALPKIDSPEIGFKAPENKEFDLWVNDETKEELLAGEVISVIGDMSFTAKYVNKGEAMYSVYFYPGQYGNGKMVVKRVQRDGEYILPTFEECNFSTKQGWKFIGWGVSGTPTVKQPGDTVKILKNEMVFQGVFEKDTTPDKVEINVQNFPDDLFRQYVSDNFDTNKDGILSKEELIAAQKIDLYKKENVKSLKGIEYFTSLTYLRFAMNHVSEVDLSKNIQLETINCAANELTNLDLTKNTKLTKLICNQNNISSLNISNCGDLEILYCNTNKLVNLNTSNNTKLLEIDCSKNMLTNLNLENNTLLTTLACTDNNLSNLNLEANTALTKIDCGNNKITDLNVNRCVLLEELFCNNNNITKLHLNNNTALFDLNCKFNQLTDLDVSKNTELLGLVCGENKLTKLDVSKNQQLDELSCQGNKIQSLDLSNNAILSLLDCSYNQLTNLDLSKNTNLRGFKCDGNIYTTNVNVINLKNLPGKFDISKAKDFTGATISNNTIIFNDNQKEVTYNYDCGYGDHVKFTIIYNKTPIVPPEESEYTITFDPRGGNVNPVTVKTVNQKIEVLPIAIKANYIFKGWFDSFGNQITTETVFTENTTVYAKWEAQNNHEYPAYHYDNETNDSIDNHESKKPEKSVKKKDILIYGKIFKDTSYGDGKITPEQFKEYIAAEKDNKAIITFASLNDKEEVIAKLSINAAEASKLSKPILTKIETNPKYKANLKANNVIKKFFTNKAKIFTFKQDGYFGMKVTASVKIDLKDFKGDTLYIYSYNIKKNVYTLVTTVPAKLDKDGYLNFDTKVGNTIIVTDKKMTPKSK